MTSVAQAPSPPQAAADGVATSCLGKRPRAAATTTTTTGSVPDAKRAARSSAPTPATSSASSAPLRSERDKTGGQASTGADGARADGWAALRVALGAVADGGVAACLSEPLVDAAVHAFFAACAAEGEGDGSSSSAAAANAVMARVVAEVRRRRSGEAKVALLNLVTAFWVRCWGRKWGPRKHTEADAAIRGGLLRALQHGTVLAGPERNAEQVDLLVCSWCDLELIDQAYLKELRRCLLGARAAAAATAAVL
eukprot:Rhum_TRINITY_DN13022_c0_g1::Rhum_TRINITY_DN13022_c0_g1_i1::g.56309::m.56309